MRVRIGFWGRNWGMTFGSTGPRFYFFPRPRKRAAPGCATALLWCIILGGAVAIIL